MDSSKLYPVIDTTTVKSRVSRRFRSFSFISQVANTHGQAFYRITLHIYYWVASSISLLVSAAPAAHQVQYQWRKDYSQQRSTASEQRLRVRFGLPQFSTGLDVTDTFQRSNGMHSQLRFVRLGNCQRCRVTTKGRVCVYSVRRQQHLTAVEMWCQLLQCCTFLCVTDSKLHCRWKKNNHSRIKRHDHK